MALKAEKEEFLIEAAGKLARALESGEVAVDDLPATVVAALRRALCQETPATMTLDRFAAEYLDEHDDLALRSLRGEALAEFEANRLHVLNDVLMRLLPKAEPMPAEVSDAVAEVKRMVLQGASWAQCDNDDVRTFEFLWSEYACASDAELSEDAIALKRRLLEIVQPGAALLAAYPHMRAVELGQPDGAGLRVESRDSAGSRHVSYSDRDSFDDALRDAEARAAKAAERTEAE